MKSIKNIEHPGRILFKQFMEPLDITSHRLAMHLRVTPQRIGEILHGKRGITAETALRLSKLFDTSPEWWLTLQMNCELSKAKTQWENIINQEVNSLGSVNSIVKKFSTKQIKTNKQITNKQTTKQQVLKRLTKDQKKIYKLLSNQPIHVDTLCKKSGMDAGNVAAILTMLELDNLIERHLDDYYSKD